MHDSTIPPHPHEEEVYQCIKESIKQEFLYQLPKIKNRDNRKL